MTPGACAEQTVRMTSLGAPPEPPESSAPRAGLRWLAVSLGALTALAVLTAVWCSVSLGWSWADALDAFVLTNAVMGLAFGGCGALLAWHRPGNAIGWLFLVGGLLQSVAAAASPLYEVLEQAGASTAVLRLTVTVFVYSWPWAIGLCIPLALLLFPDGRPVSPAWRWVVGVAALTGPLFVLEMGAAPEPVSEGDQIGYLTISGYDRMDALWTFAELGALAAYVLAFASLVIRYRRGSETTRRQLLWLVLAMVVVLPVFWAWGQVTGTPVVVLFFVPLIPVAITSAVVRHGLLDIRLVVSRALAWLLLSLLVVVAYAALVAVLDRVVSAYVSRSALATVVLVLLAAPLLPRLQRLVDRAMYGDRSDPTRVVSELGEQLATEDGGLRGVAVSIRQSLRMPWVSLSRGTELLATSGRRPERVAELPLTYGGDSVGVLEVGLRDGERRLASADQRVLGLLAAPLAVAVHATAVSAELQASRERLVGAREEERRRLRRDLHDGLGPALTGVAFTADAAANLVTDPDRAGELLQTLRARRAHRAGRRTPRGRGPAPARARRPRAGRRAAPAGGAAEPSGRRRGGPGAHRRPPEVPRAAGGGRGGGVPDRDRGADQHRPPLAGGHGRRDAELRRRARGVGRRRRAPVGSVVAGHRPAVHARAGGRARRRVPRRPVAHRRPGAGCFPLAVR